ncbi:hypothetical protein, partial [Pseudomonas syringae]|uniref:hypothetical protein n=1 Tax=Pseudomonas syringae TaxID=317 RepID=UPI000A9B10EE
TPPFYRYTQACFGFWPKAKERTCPRKGRDIRRICIARNKAFANKFARPAGISLNATILSLYASLLWILAEG